MDAVLQSLTQHQGILLLMLVLGLAASLLFSAGAYSRLRRYERRWKLLWGQTNHADLEHMLLDHLQERMMVNATLDRIGNKIEELEEQLKTSKRFLGLVRFDAFPDVAGSQSFALAVFDDQGDGAILSSIVGRNSCRVFCKPIAAGRSERDLSQEEQRAIKFAKEGGARPILSP